jgi:hypothetical protein
MTPRANPGGKLNARIDTAAKAAPDPNPPLDIPAKTTAGAAIMKKLRSNSSNLATSKNHRSLGFSPLIRGLKYPCKDWGEF